MILLPGKEANAWLILESRESAENDDEEHDLNSFMYQTVGHNVIPLYEKALGIPLYRQPIIGSAVQTGTSYSHTNVSSREDSQPEVFDVANSENEDETESLVPLLKRIIAAHPIANALSTGAILSTYQRTRIESVAIRLGLTPLSYLWKYPILPPGIQTSLLQDMEVVGLDARIVKVASGGLDESFLWVDVASEPVIRRIQKSMKRFGSDSDGAVLGEGGEFETLVVDGPSGLFKGRIEIQEKDKRIVREGGGSAWLRIQQATVVMKDSAETAETGCRIPELLEERFNNILSTLDEEDKIALLPDWDNVSSAPESLSRLDSLKLSNTEAGVIYWTIPSKEPYSQRMLIKKAISFYMDLFFIF